MDTKQFLLGFVLKGISKYAQALINTQECALPSGGKSEPLKSLPLRKFFIAVAVAAVAVLLLLLLNLAYLYGSVYHQTRRSAAFHVLLVDYNGGIVSQSLSSAYQRLQSPLFSTLFTEALSQYPTPDTIIQAVQNWQYWAAIFTSQGVSHRLSAALQGGSAAMMYNATDALTYVWNEVRYPVTADLVVQSSLSLLVEATHIAYNSINGTQALATLAQNNPAAIHIYLNTISAHSININLMPQGAKVFYNIISMAMPILQQFFFILALNGMFTRFRIYNDLLPKTSGTLRAVISLVYTLVGALCMTGYIWAFREDWSVHGYQFAETWMLLWLLMHIYFCLIDTATAVLPQPAMPFLIITWIFLNISATISPFESTPGFYWWGYALPAYSTYEILTYVWSDGPAPELHRALPIMFAWWLVGLASSTLAHRSKCRLALSPAGARSPSSNTESAFHVQEQHPKGIWDSNSEEKNTDMAEVQTPRELEQQPASKRHSKSEEQDARKGEAIVFSELEQQPGSKDNPDQIAKVTSLSGEEKP